MHLATLGTLLAAGGTAGLDALVRALAREFLCTPAELALTRPDGRRQWETRVEGALDDLVAWGYLAPAGIRPGAWTITARGRRFLAEAVA